MANVKNGSIRELIIDRCLKSRRGYSTQEIMDKCNDELDKRGEPLISALNTIRNDMLAIENRWHIVIEQIRDGRFIRYRYEDPSFSIFNSPLNEDEIMQLKQSVSLLRRFAGMPGFEWVDELNAHLQVTVNTHITPLVQFDENRRLSGLEHFTPLFNHIMNHESILLTYRSYKSQKSFQALVHPYFLKEYNQRWFLFGLQDSSMRISTFALDRIEYIHQGNKPYIENTKIDFETYLDRIIGVSIVSDSEEEDVHIWISKEQLPYILSKPMHKSQQLIEKYDDGSALISIRVIPNFELIQLLLSFGERVEVRSPLHIREEMKARIENNLRNYQ